MSEVRLLLLIISAPRGMSVWNSGPFAPKIPVTLPSGDMYPSGPCSATRVAPPTVLEVPVASEENLLTA